MCQHDVGRDDQSLGKEQAVGKAPAIAEIHRFKVASGRPLDTNLVGHDIFSAESPMAAGPPARNLSSVAQIGHVLA
jgi:hypothetical protein